jgi:hypothetical protein
MSPIKPDRPNNSAKLLIIMGILWLLLAAALLIYQFSIPASIEVEWETATELDTAGFHLYRGTSPDGEFTLVNQELIPSQGNAVSGATYAYTDHNVVPGQTYYYILEEVEADLSTNRYDNEMFSWKVPRVAQWAVLLTAVTVLAGLALLIMGLREGRNL